MLYAIGKVETVTTDNITKCKLDDLLGPRKLFRLRLLPGQLNNLHLVHLLHILQVEAQFLCFLRFLTVHLSKADRQERTKSGQIGSGLRISPDQIYLNTHQKNCDFPFFQTSWSRPVPHSWGYQGGWAWQASSHFGNFDVHELDWSQLARVSCKN